jgi:hypothetical protein
MLAPLLFVFGVFVWINMETKRCSKCKKELPLEKFSKNKCQKDGLCNQCKDCIKENYIRDREKNRIKEKEYYIKNKDRILQYSKERYQRDKEKFRQQAKEYREKIKSGSEERKEQIRKAQRENYKNNKEKIREYQNKWYDTHKEEYRQKHSEYYFKNKDKVKAYREKNKEHIREITRENQKRKMQSEIYRFSQRVRGCLNKSFKRQNIKKSKHSEELLGCTVGFFQDYLKQTFFDNYGYEYDGIEKVHIDHIIPLATAKTVEEVEKLCHYTNLQLLRAEDNLKKGSKTDYEI